MEILFVNDLVGYLVADEIDLYPMDDIMYVHFYKNGHMISSLPAFMIKTISRYNELIFISNAGCEELEKRKVDYEKK